MIVEKTIVVVASFPLLVAVIDPSITSIALAVIAALVVIIPIWFRFKTHTLNAKLHEHDVKIAEVIKTSDGMKDALVKAASSASHAEGMLEGVAQAEMKAGVQATAKANGVAEAERKSESKVDAVKQKTSEDEIVKVELVKEKE